MTKDQPDGWEYKLSIPYQTDEELDAIIYDDILGEADRIADNYWVYPLWSCRLISERKDDARIAASRAASSHHRPEPEERLGRPRRTRGSRGGR